KKVTRVLVCSGKVYYELVSYRREHKIDNIAIVRLEQQYPFPHAEYTKAVSQFPQAKEVVWVQEEPQNQGAWYRLRAYLRSDTPDAIVLESPRPRAAPRAPRARAGARAPAPGPPNRKKRSGKSPLPAGN